MPGSHQSSLLNGSQWVTDKHCPWSDSFQIKRKKEWRNQKIKWKWWCRASLWETWRQLGDKKLRKGTANDFAPEGTDGWRKPRCPPSPRRSSRRSACRPAWRTPSATHPDGEKKNISANLRNTVFNDPVTTISTDMIRSFVLSPILYVLSHFQKVVWSENRHLPLYWGFPAWQTLHYIHLMDNDPCAVPNPIWSCLSLTLKGLKEFDLIDIKRNRQFLNLC